MTSRPHRVPAAHTQEGFTLVEVVIAMTVLLVGILGMAIGFDSARKLSLVSERHATMAHVAQREIENLEGIAYANLALTGTPTHSSLTSDPDYYVNNGSPPTLQVDRTTSSSTAPIVIDTTNGAVAPVGTWSEGTLSGQIYDFVTWGTDTYCTTQCAANGQDYKRITVAITVGNGLQPTPVWLSSVMADPASTPAGGVANGTTNNPLKDPSTTCQSGTQTVSCTSPIDAGAPTTWFLHDWSSWNNGSPQSPSSNHATHPTANASPSSQCTANSTASNQTTGCPQPDLMDGNPPPSGNTTCYVYSTDQTGTPTCGRLLQWTNDSNCTQGNSAFSTLTNTNTEFLVTPPLSVSTTLTGNGGLSVSTQIAAPAVVTLCVAIYDVPPSGGLAGSLANILSWPPVYLGSSSFSPPTDATFGNWPTQAGPESFIFNFRGANGMVDVTTGHRIGVRIWAYTSTHAPIALLYDDPAYPSQLQLNAL